MSAAPTQSRRAPREGSDRARRRAAAWCAGVVAAILVGQVLLLGRVAQLKVWPDARLAEAAGTSHSRRSEMTRRGRLLDRRGRIVAASTIGYRLFIDPQEIDDGATIGTALATIAGLDAADVSAALAKRPHSRYVVVADPLASWQVAAIREAGLRGVGLDPRLQRHYPQGDVGKPLVGMVGYDHTGLSGLELAFDAELRETRGKLTYLRDARRRPMWVRPEDYQRGRAGADVQLSIDLIIQEIAERTLRRAVEGCNAGGGRLVVFDCRTGELLAMTDVLRTRPGWDEQTSDPNRALDPGLARNRCVTDPYEPGSTFKPFIWAAATELGRASMHEVLATPAGWGFRTSRGRLIRDSTYHENADWLTVLTKSLNSGMSIVAERMTHREMQEVIGRFGFGRRTNSRILGESAGIVTSPSQWSHYSQTSVAMGHEIAVTPLQMVRAFSVFARDGSMPMVRVTAALPDEPPVPFVQRVVSREIAATVRDALRLVVVDGTGQRAQSDLYRLFGKSGTAQLPIRDGGGYHEDRYVSSFIAGAPLDDPRIVVLCVIDDPDREIAHYGGAVAGPPVRDVVEEALAYLGVAPDQPGARLPVVIGPQLDETATAGATGP